MSTPQLFILSCLSAGMGIAKTCIQVECEFGMTRTEALTAINTTLAPKP